MTATSDGTIAAEISKVDVPRPGCDDAELYLLVSNYNIIEIN